MRQGNDLPLTIQVDSPVVVILHWVCHWHEERCLRVYGSMQMEDLLKMIDDEGVQCDMLWNLAPVIDDSPVVFDGLLEERRENSGEMRRVRLSW